MNIFTNFFFAKFSKIFSKTHQINCTIFNFFLGGELAPNPLPNAWLCHALHDEKRHANTPTFPRIF